MTLKNLFALHVYFLFHLPIPEKIKTATLSFVAVNRTLFTRQIKIKIRRQMNMFQNATRWHAHSPIVRRTNQNSRNSVRFRLYYFRKKNPFFWQQLCIISVLIYDRPLSLKSCILNHISFYYEFLRLRLSISEDIYASALKNWCSLSYRQHNSGFQVFMCLVFVEYQLFYVQMKGIKHTTHYLI